MAMVVQASGSVPAARRATGHRDAIDADDVHRRDSTSATSTSRSTARTPSLSVSGLRAYWTVAAREDPPAARTSGTIENPAFDAQLDSALAARDLAAARAAREARRSSTIVADVPAVWLYETRTATVVHKRIPHGPRRADGLVGGHRRLVDPASRTTAPRPDRTEGRGALGAHEALGGASLSGATTGARGGGRLHRRLAVVRARAPRARRSVLGDARQRRHRSQHARRVARGLRTRPPAARAVSPIPRTDRDAGTSDRRSRTGARRPMSSPTRFRTRSLLMGTALVLSFVLGIALGAWQARVAGPRRSRRRARRRSSSRRLPEFWLAAVLAARVRASIPHLFPADGAVDLVMHDSLSPLGRRVIDRSVTSCFPL